MVEYEFSLLQNVSSVLTDKDLFNKSHSPSRVKSIRVLKVPSIDIELQGIH